MSRKSANEKVRAAFNQRASRAQALAEQCEAAREPLQFASHIYQAQAGAVAILESGARNISGILEREAERVIVAGRTVLENIAELGPPRLAELALSRFSESDQLARQRLMAYWAGEATTNDDYLARAVLRPYVEVLADAKIAPNRTHGRGSCPFCGGSPWVAARRSSSNTDGAQRVLFCALCGGEWGVNRILCPACGEEDPRKLPSFQADAHPSVRVEACDNCHRYLKSIDLTQDARPIPEVDDLVSLSVDVWATEQGYSRLEPGLAGI